MQEISLDRLYAHLERDPDLAQRIGHLLLDPPPSSVESPQDIYKHVGPLLIGAAQERMVVLALDKKLRPLGKRVVSIGNDSFTLVCPRQIFRWALSQGRSGASYLAMAHNHPSGDHRPSTEDGAVTDRIADAGKVIGIPLVDHLVVADHAFTSMAEIGEIRNGYAVTRIHT